MTTQISAGIIIYRYTKEGIKFLLLYHGHNYWNFPKGKIEKDENAIITALREVYEETGLKRSSLKFKKGFKTSERYMFRAKEDKSKIFKIVTFYLAETSEPIIKVSKEHLGYGWFSLSESIRVLYRYKNTAEIIKKAYYLIRKDNHFFARAGQKRFHSRPAFPETTTTELKEASNKENS